MPPPNDDLSGLLGQLNPQQLQGLHSALYSVKYGTLGSDPSQYDQDKIGKLWDAIQPVVARGGGAAHTAVDQIASEPVTAAPKDTRTWFQKLYTPAPDAPEKVEGVVHAMGGKVQSPSQYEAYLNDPAKPKSQWEAFNAGLSKSADELVAGQFMNPLGAVTAAAPIAEAGAVLKAGSALRAGATATKALQAAVEGGDAAKIASATAQAKAALGATQRMKTTADVLKGTSAAAGQLQGIQGDVAAYQDLKEGRYSEGATNAALAVLGHGAGLYDIARNRGVNTAGEIVDSAVRQQPKARPVTSEVVPPPETPKGMVKVQPSPMPRGNASPIDVKPTAVETKTVAPTPSPIPKAETPSAPQTPKDIVEGQGLVYKGELMPGSGVHMLEDPAHPGKTAAIKEPFTAADAATKMQSKLAEFAANPSESPAATLAKNPVVPPKPDTPAASSSPEKTPAWKGADGSLVPSKLPDGPLKALTQLSQGDALAKGINRDDWLAAKKEGERRFGDAPVFANAQSATVKPVENIHSSITRIVNASSHDDLTTRTNEFNQHLETLQTAPPQIQASTADTLEHRAGQASTTASNIQRAVAAQDFAVTVKQLRAQTRFEAETSSRGLVDESNENSEDKTRMASKGRYATPTTESIYNDLVGGRAQGPKARIYDPDTKAPSKIPGGSPEEVAAIKDFVDRSQAALDQHVAEVKAQGGVPTAKQVEDGTRLLEGIQNATGFRHTFKGQTSEINPDQSAWNKWMGKPETSHFAKPTGEEVARRLNKLQTESALATQAATRVRGMLPKDYQATPPVKKESIEQTLHPAEATAVQQAVASPPKPTVVAQSDKPIAKSEPTPRLLQEKPADSPSEYEGHSDDLLHIIQASEDVSSPMKSGIAKLHDITPEEDRDYLAHTIVASNPNMTPKEWAARYAGSLQTLREGLKKGMGVAAQARAQQFAMSGGNVKLGSKGDQSGWIAPSTVTDLIDDINRAAVNGIVKAVDVGRMMHQFVNNGTYGGMPEASKSALYKYRGDINTVEDLGRAAFNGIKESIQAMPMSQRLEAFRKASAGEAMGSPDEQMVRDAIQQMQDRNFIRLRNRGISVEYYEHHIGTRWAKKPNSKSTASVEAQAARMAGASQLQGNQAFKLQRTFKDVLDGMAQGGIPVTTNWIEMSLLDLGNQEKLIAAHDLFDTLTKAGRMGRGVKTANALTEPERVPDNVRASYFPVETVRGEIVMQRGEPYYMEKGELEVLKNALNPDLLRRSVIGKTFMGAKNIISQVALYSPFHFMSIGAKQIAGGVGQGLTRLANQGVVQGDVKEMLGGLKDLVTAVAAPYQNYKRGKALLELGGQTLTGYHAYQGSVNNFLASKNGQFLVKNFGGIDVAKNLISGILEGGMHMGVDSEYSASLRAKVQNSLASAKLLERFKGLALAVPATLEEPMGALMERYIPVVKIGAAAKEIASEQARNAPMIANGEITSEEVNRRAVRRIENRLGQMNWANISMSKGYKNALQFLYTSFTWRIGTLGQMKGAIHHSVQDISNAYAYKRAPTLDPDLANVIGDAVVAMLQGGILMALFGKQAATTIKDWLYPKTGDKDSRGKDIRVSPLSYWSEYEKAGSDFPNGLANYALGGRSPIATSMFEAYNNRNFQGDQISDKEGVASWPGRVGHIFSPKNFMTGSYDRYVQQGMDPKKAAALSFFALNPAPSDMDMTDAEKILSKSERRVQIARSPEERAKQDVKRSIEGAHASKNYPLAKQIAVDALKAKTIAPDEMMDYLTSSSTQSYFERMVESVAKGGKPQDLIKAYGVATQQERAMLLKEIPNILEKNPKLSKDFQEARSKPPAIPEQQ